MSNLIFDVVAPRCNTLQHTATHCNTLQHTATQCNTLQHTSTHYNPLRPTTTHYNPLQNTATSNTPISNTPNKTLQLTETHCNTATFHHATSMPSAGNSTCCMCVKEANTNTAKRVLPRQSVSAVLVWEIPPVALAKEPYTTKAVL